MELKLPVVGILCTLLLLTGVQQCAATSVSDDEICKNSSGTDLISNERRLLACLMRYYNRAVRPVQNIAEVITVVFNPILITITDLNEKTGVLTSDHWIEQIWNDSQLMWKPSDYGQVTEIRIPIEKLWNPDIALLNNAGESNEYILGNMAVVSSTGQVKWAPHTRLRSYCTFDPTMFPFDSQECFINVGTWMYDTHLVRTALKPDNDWKIVYNGKEWEILSYDGTLSQFNYDGRDFPGLTYTLRMKRSPIYYRYMLVTPSIMLAMLTLLMFWVPPQSGERFMLASGIVVSITLLFILLENFLPTDLGRLPVVASYLAYNFLLVVLTVFFSIISFNLYHRDTRSSPLPGWMRWIFLGNLSKLLCVRSQPYSSIPLGLAAEENAAQRELRDLLPEILDTDDNRNFDLSPRDGHTASPTMTIEKTMDEIRRYLRYLSAHAELEGHQRLQHRDIVVNEWHQVALVIDRLLFAFFVLITIVVSVSLYGHY